MHDAMNDDVKCHDDAKTYQIDTFLSFAFIFELTENPSSL